MNVLHDMITTKEKKKTFHFRTTIQKREIFISHIELTET